MLVNTNTANLFINYENTRSIYINWKIYTYTTHIYVSNVDFLSVPWLLIKTSIKAFGLLLPFDN